MQSLHVFPVPPWALSAYSGFLPLSNDKQATYSKIARRCECEHEGLFVSPAMNCLGPVEMLEPRF